MCSQSRIAYRHSQGSCNELHHWLITVTCLPTVAGEYGELLLGKADTPLQDGEEPLSVSSQELVQVLETVLSRPTIKPVGREYALTALMKLSTRLPDHSQYIQVAAHMRHNAFCSCILRPFTPLSWNL